MNDREPPLALEVDFPTTHGPSKSPAPDGRDPAGCDIRLRDLEFGRELAAFSLFDRGVFSVAFSSDGRWLAAGGEPVPERFAEGGQAPTFFAQTERDPASGL